MTSIEGRGPERATKRYVGQRPLSVFNQQMAMLESPTSHTEVISAMLLRSIVRRLDLLPLLIAIAAAQSQGAAAIPPPAVKCEYDPKVLDLGFDAFDQDMKGGWRPLSETSGCENKAADLVRDYRRKYQSMMPILYWHEAQIRASIGENNEAIDLMRRSYEPGFGDETGWNQYVDATIAFLRSDKPAFLKARDRLRHLQKPEGWPRDGEWPQNGSVVEGLWKCFGKPYKIAYRMDCRPETVNPK